MAFFDIATHPLVIPLHRFGDGFNLLRIGLDKAFKGFVKAEIEKIH